jgi:protein-S-isoprenylcysteine O-methyltransferase Ste14
MDLRRRALAGLAQFVVTLGALLFLSAWSLRFWQAWLFLALFSASITGITLDLMRRDPALLERRLHGLDHRFGWSHVPVSIVLAGDGLVVIGLYIVFLVFRENSFTSGIIEVASDQRVISTGPYRIVRHPMYAGALVMILGMPLALGSAWGVLVCLPMAAAIIVRLIDEERYLVRHLIGYAEYRERTRYRLVPGLY